MAPAPLRAITNFSPDVLPLLAPLKGPATDRANLRRPITWTHPGRSDGSDCHDGQAWQAYGHPSRRGKQCHEIKPAPISRGKQNQKILEQDTTEHFY